MELVTRIIIGIISPMDNINSLYFAGPNEFLHQGPPFPSRPLEHVAMPMGEQGPDHWVLNTYLNENSLDPSIHSLGQLIMNIIRGHAAVADAGHKTYLK